MLIPRGKALKIAERLFVVVAVIVVTAVIVRATDRKFSGRVAGVEEGSDGCPTDMVFTPSPAGGFCIDKYEASPGNGCPYGNPGNQRETRLNLDYSDCLPAVRRGAVPWRYISQNQAALACARAGKRLPTNKEWMLAALGTPDPDSGWSGDDCQVDKNWSAQPGPAGSGKNCLSAAGAYDMIGNVWEWVDGTIKDGVYRGKILPSAGYVNGVDEDALPGDTKRNKSNPDYYYDFFWIKNIGTRALARGGYWNNRSAAGQYALYMEVPPSYAGEGIGFRCAK